MKVKEYEAGELKRLPDWVKCMKCQGKPLENDWLIEIIPNSNALMHQSCAGKQGQLAGLNIGMEKGD